MQAQRLRATLRRLWRPRLWFGLAALLLLVWVLGNVSLRDTWVVLSRLTLVQILVLVAVNALVLLTFSGRWWLILRAQGHRIPYFTLAGYRLMAFAVSYFTPGPQFGGEPLQVVSVRHKHAVPVSEAIAAVTLDKALELLANFTFLMLGVLFILQRQIFTYVIGLRAATLALLLLALPLVFILALWNGQMPLSTLLNLAARILRIQHRPPFRRVWQTIASSEDRATRLCRAHPRALVQAFLVSVVSWVAMVGEYWLALRFLGVTLPLTDTIIALTAARIAYLLPMPGGLGTLEASQIVALELLGMRAAVGLSISLLIRTRDVLLGLLGLWLASLNDWQPPIKKRRTLK